MPSPEKTNRKYQPKILFLLCQFSFLIAASAFADEAELVRGIVSSSLDKKGISGALVVLYDADKQTLVNFTYTSIDGTFSFHSPLTPGKYSLAATKADLQCKTSLDIPSTLGASNHLLKCEVSISRLDRIANWIDHIPQVLVGLVGLLLGWFCQLIPSARQFSMEMATWKNEAKSILRLRNTCVQLFERSKQMRQDDNTETQKNRKLLKKVRKDIETHFQKIEVIHISFDRGYPIFPGKMISNVESANSLAREINDIFRDLNYEQILQMKKPDIEEVLEKFNRLTDNPLLKSSR
jgi:hypothetical protein